MAPSGPARNRNHDSNGEMLSWQEKTKYLRTIKHREKLQRQGKNYEQVRPAEFLCQADCVQKEERYLRVFHLGLGNESVLADIVHEAFFFWNLFRTNFLLPAGFVVLHRGCPDVTVLADEIQVSLFALNLFLSNFCSHLNTSKP